MTELLRELVEIESASDDPAGLAAMADRLAELFAPFGSLTRHPAGPSASHHLDLTIDGSQSDVGDVLVIGHFDTVWRRGTLADMPFTLDSAGVARGPGCFDMKGGLVQLYFALHELARLGIRARRRIRILFNCDEEIGSPSSRALIEQFAAAAVVAYVLESPLPGGALKTQRKGSAMYTVEITGRAAHAGIEPGRGASAVLELAHQIHAIHALNDADRGTSVNVGIVSGGSRVNVVPPSAAAQINARTTTKAEAERVRTAISALTPTVPDTRVASRAGLSRPPMERTPEIGSLFAAAQRIAAELGSPPLQEGATGGASDANLVAALGVPTLDGLGPEGGGAHADDEHVLVESMPRRAALIAGLLAGS
ncbi:MAG TPA: M20 family metallopeptidase [Jatrophihabitans sp.]|nr:M20 family metallopeptidase [Jatrophihabitans sp.]